jgi:hypothetical protein
MRKDNKDYWTIKLDAIDNVFASAKDVIDAMSKSFGVAGDVIGRIKYVFPPIPRLMENLLFRGKIDGVLFVFDKTEAEHLYFPTVITDYDGDKPAMWSDLLEQQADRILEIALEMRILADVVSNVSGNPPEKESVMLRDGYFYKFDPPPVSFSPPIAKRNNNIAP